MGINDPYGLIASGLPPELAAQAMGLSRQEMVAQALLQQSQTPMQAPEAKGRFQGRISPMEGIAKLVQAYLGQQGLSEADRRYSDLAQQAQTGRADALQQYEKIRTGTPAVPYNDTLGSEAPEAPVSPGVKGDPRKAVEMALNNAYLARNPMVAADLKRTEPKWEVKKSFDSSGKEVQTLVNLNDPTQTMPFGNSKATTPVQVTTVDPETKRPVIKFVDPTKQTEALPQPVKMTMEDTGKVIVPVDPYNPPVGLGKTTTPGQDQSRRTSLQTHGLGEDGLPTGDIKDVAQAIARYDMAPLSSWGMSSPRGQQIMSEVMKANPEYDVKNFHAADKAVKDFSSGKQGNTVRSFNVAISHLDTLSGLADALHNGDTQLINKAGNFVSTQLGGPAPVNFEAAKKIVGDEIVKAIVGSGGGVHDREEASKTVAAASSPAQLKGVINTYKELMRGQLGGLKQQYEQSTGRRDFDKFLSSQGMATAKGGGSSDLFNQADEILKGK